MKKQLLFLGIFYGIMLQSHQLCNQKILREIVCSHTGLLDCTNMYEKQLDSAALCNWKNVIMRVGNFLENNAQKQKKLLLDYFAEMHKANCDLINNIKKIYRTKINKTFDITIHQTLRSKLEKIEKRARFIQKSLYWVDDTNAHDAQAIKCAQHLAHFIAVTVRKARLDLSRLDTY